MKHAIAPGPFAPATGAGPDKNTQRSAGRHILANPLVLTWAGLMQLGCNLALAQSHGVPQVELAIDPAPLDEALVVWARKTGYQVLMSPDQMAGEGTSPRLRGTYTPEAALEVLLSRSDLGYRFVNSNTVAISSQITDSDRLLVRGRSPGVSAPSMATSTSAVDMDGGNDVGGDAGGGSEAEIIVSAQKRDERLQDVPVPVTAISANSLVESNQLKIQDYYASVPGLNLTTDARGNALLSIRGVTTGANVGNPTVGITVDDVPFGSSSTYGSVGGPVPDIDPSDLARVEVLRGPQGTLYGANALGGLFKYVTNAPDPTRLSAKVEAGASSVDNGGPGYDVHGMVNVPLGDTAAFRAVGYTNYYPGFIDNPARNASGVNASRFSGGRASFQWAPTADLTIRLNALYQDRQWDDYPNEDVNPGTLTPIYGNYKQVTVIGQPGNDRTQIYNATIHWDLGFAKLISATSYSNNQWNIKAVDYTKQFGAFLNTLPGAPYGFDVSDVTTLNAITQEVRLSSSNNTPLEWQLGGYFANQNSTELQPYYPVDLATHTVLFGFPTNVGAFDIPVHYHEYAAFADLDYHFTQQLDAAVGGRYSKNIQTFHEVGTGLFGAGIDIANQSSEHVFTYSADLRWHFGPQDMIYARVAKGFTPGGPNNEIPNAVVQSSYHSSTTLNYELGLKSQFLDQRLTMDLSVFDIEWRNIQVVANIKNFLTTTNAGSARSEGFEWAFDYILVKGLSINWNGAYTFARLTEDAPESVGGLAGDRLPSVPLWQSSIGVQYQQRIAQGYSAFIGLNWRFTGDRFADFVPATAAPRQRMPSYRILDLRAGVEAEGWSVALYAKNLANAIAFNYLSPEINGGQGPQSASLYTPRTIGVSVTKDF